MSSEVVETDAEFDSRYIAYFDRADIDGWEIRKGMSDLCAMDLVPEPSIVAASLRACRRVGDYALTTRILETIKLKCGNKEAEIWPYVLQELAPTLEELGVLTPEQLGYDKPELALPNPYDMH
jgi:cytochrome c oxidase subunit 5a